MEGLWAKQYYQELDLGLSEVQEPARKFAAWRVEKRRW